MTSFLDSSLYCELHRQNAESRQLTQENIYSMIDRDTLFRWVYIPFVFMDIMWDYIDTVHDIAVIRRTYNLKKSLRHLFEIQKDCEYDKARYVEPGFVEKEKAHADFLEEEMNDLLKEIYDAGVIGKEEMILDDRWLIGSIYVAYVFYESVWGYTESFRKKIGKKLNIQTRNILPKDFFKIRDILRSMCHICDIKDLSRVPEFVQKVIKEMDEIILVDTEEKIKEL